MRRGLHRSLHSHCLLSLVGLWKPGPAFLLFPLPSQLFVKLATSKTAVEDSGEGLLPGMGEGFCGADVPQNLSGFRDHTTVYGQAVGLPRLSEGREGEKKEERV